MIDPLLLFVETEPGVWKLDINIKKGWMQEVPSPRPINTTRQRKVILAYQTRSTIPGDWNRGVPWGTLLSTPGATMADAIMEVQQALSTADGSEGTFAIPLVTPTVDGGQRFRILTVDPNNMEEFTNVGT